MRRLLALAVLALLWLPPAAGELDGDPACSGKIYGEDIETREPTKEDAIVIPAGADVHYELHSQKLVDHWTVRLHFGPFAIPVDRGTPTPGEDGFSEVDTIPASSYSWMGRGLFRLSAEIIHEDGTECNGAVMLDLDGNPLASLLGVLSILMIVAAAAGLIMSFMQNSRPEKATRAR